MNSPPAQWPAPATIGMRVEDVDTPALIADLDVLERNLARMADFARSRQIRLRPHAKMHKTPAVALRQIALGAVGVCCQKVSEAEALAAAGVKDILITNQIVGNPKLVRLAALARLAQIGVCVDAAENVRHLSPCSCAPALWGRRRWPTLAGFTLALHLVLFRFLIDRKSVV